MLHLRQGDELRLGSEPTSVTVLTADGPQTATIDPGVGPTLVVQVPDVDLTTPAGAAATLSVCG